MKLGEVLIDKGLLTEDRLMLALSQQKITSSLLGETLVKLGFVSSSEIAKTLAEQASIPFINISEYTVSEDAIRLIPKEIAEKTGFIPLRMFESIKRSMWKSSSLGTEVIASLVCSVERTRCPVMEARTAIRAVSSSLISPRSMTSGSCLMKFLPAIAKS